MAVAPEPAWTTRLSAGRSAFSVPRGRGCHEATPHALGPGASASAGERTIEQACRQGLDLGPERPVVAERRGDRADLRMRLLEQG